MVGDTPPIVFRERDGSALHRATVNGVQIEVKNILYEWKRGMAIDLAEVFCGLFARLKKTSIFLNLEDVCNRGIESDQRTVSYEWIPSIFWIK